MIQQIILGVWVCLATLGGIYGADLLIATERSDAMSVRVGGITYSKMLPISVPVLRDGELDGYVVAQFVYGISDTGDKHVAERVEPYFIDAVFRVLYNESKAGIQRDDLENIKKEILDRVNASLGDNIVQEALIDQINYISVEQVRCSKQVE
ncbi:MAG: flagellar basal body-associated FliL family protein [Alphaproteobacteria bacterium]|nr:flagellar basal body-associated FliL family protein [Alphaproteobacteria bacterium]